MPLEKPKQRIMRNPTIHITLSTLTDVLGKMGSKNPDKVALRIFTLAHPFNIKDRYLVSSTADVRKKVLRSVATAKQTSMTVQRFNFILTTCRMEVGHRHITPIREGGRDMNMLKEICQIACEFCANTNIANIEEGCKTFIQLGLHKMKHSNTYGLNKFKYYENDIYRMYESAEMVSNDPKPRRTRRFYTIYQTLLAEYAGIDRDYSDIEYYVCFVCARLEAERVKADPEDWLRAQFEELVKWVDAIPTPNQLFSDNALKRYNSYCKSIKKAVVPAEDVIDWDKSKNSFEQLYAEKIRGKYAEA